MNAHGLDQSLALGDGCETLRLAGRRDWKPAEQQKRKEQYFFPGHCFASFTVATAIYPFLRKTARCAGLPG
jgi:hypothetical protein